MIPIELELKTCPTCSGRSMIEGERCPDCRGRGVVRRRAGDVPDPETPEAPPPEAGADTKPTGLARFAALKARAKELGLSAKGKAAELEAAIAAEEARLTAEVAAAVQDGGETTAEEGAPTIAADDDGGDETPADDSEASPSDEAGTPPV